MRTRSVRVEDIIEDISMGPFGSDIKVECFTTSGVPLLNGSNLQKVRLIEEVENYVTEEKAQELKKALARPHDIVITHRGTLGQASYVPEGTPYPYYLISQSQFRVRFNAEEVYAPYIAYYLHSSEGQGKLLSFKNHVGVPALARATSNFRKLQFNLPEIDEQKRIANTLIAYDEKIKHNNELIKLLEEQAQLVYDYWFMQFDFPDENGRPYRSRGGKMVWSEELKREIPEGWRGATLNVVAEMAAGARKDDDYEMYLSTDDMLQNKQGIVFSTKRAPGAGGIASHPHDTLISNIRPYLKKIWYSDMESSVSADVLIFRSKTNHPGFLYFTLRRDEFFAHMMTGAKGAKMPRGDKHQINRYPIALPADMSTVAEYEAYVQLILAKIASASRENRLLTAQRDFLLPLLMSGQVTVAE